MGLFQQILADRRVWFVFLFALILRLVLLPFAEVTDADAVTRIYLAQDWLSSPELISEGVWPPIHYYFIAFSMMISGESWYGPMVLHILFACLTVFPLYRFTKREFGERGAIFAVLIYVLSPAVFRNSYHALSGIPNAFFVACALDQLSLLRKEQQTKFAIYAGIAITLGAGFRYESWMLIAIFTGMLLLFRIKLKQLFVFWLVAMIFPAFWMVGNYLAHGDLFYGLSGAYHWNVVMEGVNENVDASEYAKRLVFFPLSWLLVITPIVGLGLLWHFTRGLIKRTFERSTLIWSLPFLLLFVVFIYKSYEGTLLNQHRFSIGLLVLSVPFTVYLIQGRSWLRRLVYFSIPISIYLSFSGFFFAWESVIPSKRAQNVFKSIRLGTYESLVPIPRQTDREISKVGEVITTEVETADGLLIDFWTWESSFYLSLRSGMKSKDIYLVDGAANGSVYEAELIDFLEKHQRPIIFLNCSSKLAPYCTFSTDSLTITVMDRPFSFPAQLNYMKDGSAVITTSNQGRIEFDCPENASKAAFRSAIRRDLLWYNDVRIKAYNNGLTVDQMLDKEAEWLVQNQ